MGKKKQTVQLEDLDLNAGKDFYTLLAEQAEEEKERLVGSILAQVKAGDSTAFKLLEKALLQKQQAGTADGRPIVFMPIEIMDREGIEYELPVTRSPEDDSQG